MSPLNAAICTTISFTLWVEWYYLKKQLFDLEVKGQGPMKVITVCDTPPYGHAPTYQMSLTYLERQKCYGLDKKMVFIKNNYLTWKSKVKVPRRSLWYATHRLIVMHPHTKYHWPISKDKKVMNRTSFAEKKRKKKIRLKQYVSLRSKERHNNTFYNFVPYSRLYSPYLEVKLN